MSTGSIVGTRIIYERRFLLQMRNSPLAKTPPVSLATIPDIINEDVTIDLPQKIKPVEPKRREICSKGNPCKYVHTVDKGKWGEQIHLVPTSSIPGPLGCKGPSDGTHSHLNRAIALLHAVTFFFNAFLMQPPS